MEITREDAEVLISQIQHAHRLSVAFYQRLLALIDDVAAQTESSFWYWNPLHRLNSPRSDQHPSSRWSWDFIPLYASRHAYGNSPRQIMRESDYAVIFDVYLDENIDPAIGLVAKKMQPSPIALPMGESIVKIYVLRSIKRSSKKFMWDYWLGQDITIDNAKWQSVGTHLVAAGVRFSLIDFLTKPDQVIRKLKNLLHEQIELNEDSKR